VLFEFLETSWRAATPERKILSAVRGDTTAWSVYIIRCGDDSLYTGITTDVARRFSEHQSGSVGSKYLRGRAPLKLVFDRQVGDRSLASKIEHRIKKLPRPEKDALLSTPSILDDLILEVS